MITKDSDSGTNRFLLKTDRHLFRMTLNYILVSKPGSIYSATVTRPVLCNEIPGSVLILIPDSSFHGTFLFVEHAAELIFLCLSFCRGGIEYSLSIV